MKMSRVLIASLVGLAAGVSTSATAGPIEGLEVMRTYNLVTLGNLQNSSEVEGRTHVGGNLSGSSNYNVGGAGFQAAGDAPKLQVGGNIGSGWQNIQGGGSVVAGGNISQINLNGGYYTVKAGGAISGVNANGNSLQSNAAVDVPMFDDDFLSLSTALASLSDTGGSTTIQGQNRIFNPVADQNGVAVFNVDSLTNLLASNGNDIVSGLGFGAGSSDLDTIVINVADTEFSLQERCQ
jgi:choice-of-anchor A domain-containing protein|tara:strand:+ start:121006 stop:121716 length:711 start_codon:yes stop_codon:yes gene_type:complete